MVNLLQINQVVFSSLKASWECEAITPQHQPENKHAQDCSKKKETIRDNKQTTRKAPKRNRSDFAMGGGGGKKRGVENLTNDTPPRFWTPPRTVRFPPPSGVSALFFLYKIPRQSRPEALLEGSKHFRESAFSGMVSSPHMVCTPPYHGPNRYHTTTNRNVFDNEK